MRVGFTAAAVEDLETIATYLAANYPRAAAAVERRLRIVIARIARWPESSQRVSERPEVRMAPPRPLPLRDLLPRHLYRYAAEFDFHYNRRSGLGTSDAERAAAAVRGIAGKRPTYRNPHYQA